MKESEIKIIGNEEDLKMIEKVEGEEGDLIDFGFKTIVLSDLRHGR